MKPTNRAILLTPLLAALGCSVPCGNSNELSNTSAGTYRYVESNAPASGTTSTNGGFPGSVLTLSTNMDGVFSVEGTFTDASGQQHDVTLSIVGASAGASMPIGSGSTLVISDCAPGASDGACSYINQTTVPLSGTLVASTFTTDCHDAEGCALSIVGTLVTTASWGDATFSSNLSLNYQSVWETVACPTNNSNDSS